jgi:cyanophycinase-like exopeptidase
MLGLLKGMGKAYKEAQKAKKADKLYQSKRTDVYGPNQKLSEDTKKLNKQLKTIKQVGAGVAGTIAGAAVVGKVKQNNKDKQKGRK